MDAMSRVHISAPAWRALRACCFAAVSVGVGAAGHAMASGSVVHAWVVAIAVLLAASYAHVLGAQRVRPFAMLASVAAIQAFVHVALVIAQSPVHEHHVAPGAHAQLPIAMLAVHAVATLLGVAVLLRLERAAWRVVRAVARAIGSIWRRPECIESTHVRIVHAVAGARLALDAWRSVALGRRGPPFTRFA